MPPTREDPVHVLVTPLAALIGGLTPRLMLLDFLGASKKLAGLSVQN